MRRHDVDGNFVRLFNDVNYVGKFSMFKINLSYFPSRARLNFRWILILKSSMKGFFENFLALSLKKLKKVLMILISQSSFLLLLYHVVIAHDTSFHITKHM